MAAVYERLRAAVLTGQARPDGLAVLVFHGFIEGLKLLCHGASMGSAAVPLPLVRAPPPAADRELLHLLANMLLQTQSEVTHVY